MVKMEREQGAPVARALVDLSEAFERLRGYARDHGLRLSDVARAAVEGSLGPEAWSSPRARGPRDAS